MSKNVAHYYDLMIRTFSTAVTLIFVVLTVALMLKSNILVGKDFWKPVEVEFYRFANEPELKVDNKDKLIDALHKIHVKLKPYVDALIND